jgi:hypothetical protein
MKAGQSIVTEILNIMTMKGKFILKKKWKFVVAFLMILSGKPGFANFPAETACIPDSQDECLITLKSQNGVYRNLEDSKTTYLIQVENKGSSPVNLTLSVQNQNQNCQNPDNSGNASNVLLILELLDATTNQAFSSATVAPGELFTFTVKAVAPQNTPFNTWSCAEVRAVPGNCTGSPVTLTLFSYVPDPSPEE